MTSSSPSDQDRAGWHVIPDPSNAIVGCDDCGHARGLHSREVGVGCLHRWAILDPDLDSETCPCLRAGSSEADQ